MQNDMETAANAAKTGVTGHHRLSVAPMMEWTDRHCRYFLRLLTRHTLLYTEMVTSATLIHGDVERHLAYNPEEHPIALQLGGSDPGQLAHCGKLGEDYGYDEINLNVGCPSPRVQEGRFGACLMAEPALVAECIAAIQQSVKVPITVKTRIGIDELDSYEYLCRFVAQVASAGCQTFIIHARKAWLHGLSPEQNRTVPPLRYDVVRQLKQDFSSLTIILNGGVSSLDEAENHLLDCDGVMIGRAAYHNPYILAVADQRIFGASHPVVTRDEIGLALLPYIATQLQQGVRLHAMTRHFLGLFHGVPGGRAFRRHLSEQATRREAGVEVWHKALEFSRSLAKEII